MKVEPNTKLHLVGKTHRAKNCLANFGDMWTVKHATRSKHEGIFIVADGPLFEAMWLDEKEFEAGIVRDSILTDREEG